MSKGEPMKKQPKPLLIRWLLHAVSIVVASLITQALGFQFKVNVDSFGSVLTFLVGVALLAFANATLGKILKMLVIPLNCLTLGLFSFVVNAVVLLVVARLGLGIKIDEAGPVATFLAALVASLLISILYNVINNLLPDKNE
jgi:putative membrane protein